MSYPSYNKAENLPTTGSNSTGRWKAFVHNDTSGNKKVSVQTFNGEGVTFEGIAAGTVFPIAFNTLFVESTDVADGKLLGLN